MRTTESTNSHHDVVVVGARAGGAATAMLLARAGWDVALLDRATFPSDTMSTHQLARPGVVQLHRWGLLDAVLASGTPAIRQVSFAAGGEVVTRTVKDSAGVDLLVAPRRYVLDTLLVEEAVRSGATLHTGVTVTGLRRHPSGRVVGVECADGTVVHARHVVGADGLNSAVARWVGAPMVEQRPATGAVQYAYVDGLAWSGIELIIADRALAGVFPTHHDQAVIWIGMPTAVFQRARRAASVQQVFDAELRRAAPELTERLRAGRQVSPVRGLLRAPNHLRRPYGPGWSLVGDAGYHRDPITGHGLSDAYRDAELLAEALDRTLSGRLPEQLALAAYQLERDETVREVFDLTCALAAYPAPATFVELQKQLGRALDAEASALAARPQFGARTLACA